MTTKHAIVHKWVHVSYAEDNTVTETYGFVGSQGRVNLEGLLFCPVQDTRDTVFLMMHPSSTLQLLPLPGAMAHAGHAVLCMGSRYAKNDTALICEKLALDLNACIRHAKEQLGYRHVVLLGWSGGGSLALFPRFLDGSIEPNDRPIGHCYLGVPETVNSGPVGLARFSMLRSWLSQWSLTHSRADGETCARDVTVPLLAIEHSADDAVPQPDVRLMFEACASTDKQFHCIEGANHYFKGQPELRQQSITRISGWAQQHGW